MDNTVYRLGWAPTRAAARQYVSHGLVRVNNKKMDVPSYRVQVNDVISLTDKAMKVPVIAQMLDSENADVPSWLERKKAVGKVAKLPVREDIKEAIEEQLVVEYYSR